MRIFASECSENMRKTKEGPSTTAGQASELISAVKELQKLNSQELNRLLRESENLTVHCQTENGLVIKVEVEKFVGFLPLHLVAVLVSVERDQAMFRYFLCGLRLLHALCDLASRHNKIEKILLENVKISEQLIDLVIYALIVLGGCMQEADDSGPMTLLHSASVACSLHLLTGFISSQWTDVVHVLLAHPKIDVFMDVAFRAVCTVSRSLLMKLLSPQSCNSLDLTAEQMITYLCQQCEASVQFLHSLCQNKTFRERLLRNKELCGRGGVLILAKTILQLEIPSSLSGSYVIAATSRLKAKILSILLHLCEAESISYLDEVAVCPGSLDLAKSVVKEVLNILKTTVSKDCKNSGLPSDRRYPSGLLQLNALRLTDIFSDESNFRSYITTHFTEVLTAIFSISHGDFLSCWCSSDPPVREEDATLEYDPYASAGLLLNDTSALSQYAAERHSEFGLVHNNLPQSSYAHQRTSLFVKIIANLHCFIPNICEEQDRNLFLHKFLEALGENLAPGSYYMEKASIVCINLRSLLSHAQSLIPTHLHEEDVQLLRVFFDQLHSSLLEKNGVKVSKDCGKASLDEFAKLRITEHQGSQSLAGGSHVLSRSIKKEGLSENFTSQDMDDFYVRSKHSGEDEGKTGDSGVGVSREPDRDVQNIETSGSDSSSVKGKNSVDQMENGDSGKPSRRGKGIRLGGVQEDDKFEATLGEEKQQRKKRKRTIMNDEQIAMIESALVDEPEMQRHAALIQSWADKLTSYGSEVTCSQLKNWLNNRKARLARAAKETRAPPEVENNAREKLDSPESTGIIETYISSSSRGRPRNSSRSAAAAEKTEAVEFSRFEQGQHIALVDSYGDEIGKGTVFQVRGSWFGKNLEEMETYVLDITELKVRRWRRLPYPSEATGNSFEEAEEKLGIMRVLWDSNKVINRPNK